MGSSYQIFNETMASVGGGNKAKSDSSRWEYLKIGNGQVAELRLLNHKPFVMFNHGFRAKGRYGDFRCTGREASTGNRCVGCFYGSKELQKCTTRKQYVFTVVDLTLVHRLNAPKTKDGYAKIDEKLCTGPRCNICKEGNAAIRIGRRHWSVGSGHKEVIQDANFTIGDHCFSCKTGEISLKSLVCSKCGEPLLDDHTLSELPIHDLKKQVLIPYTCNSCGFHGFPEEELVCSDCETPVRASIFDTNIKVSKIKAPGSEYTTLKIEPTYKWEVLPDDIIKVEPYDFARKVFPLFSLEVQAAMMHLNNPFEGISRENAIPANREEEVFGTLSDGEESE